MSHNFPIELKREKEWDDLFIFFWRLEITKPFFFFFFIFFYLINKKDITDLESFSSLLKDFVIPIDALAMFTMSATLYCSKTTGKQVIDLVW